MMQPSAYLNNSYLMMMEGGNRQPDNMGPSIQHQQISGMLYNQGAASNTSQIMTPVSQLLDNSKSNKLQSSINNNSQMRQHPQKPQQPNAHASRPNAVK